MISCILQGGLGNQLFQIAAAYSLSIDLETDFGINHNYCHTPYQGHASNKYKDIFFKKITEIEKIPSFLYQEQSHNFSPLPRISDLTLRGYFQSEKYFERNKEKIIELFYPSEDFFNKLTEFKSRIDNKKLVGIHIRRGDYLKLSHHHLITPLSYYLDAMSKFENTNFIIASDDIQWAKDNIIGENVFYSDFNDEILDFCLLTSCDHNIIGNSSFSWWAAYLNKNTSKRIIAPSRWFTDSANCDISDIYPESWTIIQT